MKKYVSTLTLAMLTILSGISVAQDPSDRIRNSGIREQVKVHGTVTDNVAVTVIPPLNLSADSCAGFSAKDFELRVEGQPRDFTLEPAGNTAGGTAKKHFVILLSATDIAKPVCGFDAYQIAKAQTLDWARRVVPNILEEDALGITVFTDHVGTNAIRKGLQGPWASNPDEALSMIASAEPELVYPNQEHQSFEYWYAGLEALTPAWAEAAHGEEVFVLFPTGPLPQLGKNPGRDAMLAATLASNHIRMIPVCWGFSQWSTYRDLAQLSGGIALGGRDLEKDTNGLELAVERIRELDQCRFNLRFRLTEKDLRRKLVRTKVSLGEELTKQRFTVTTPAALGNPKSIPAPEARLETFIKLPKVTNGFEVKAGIFPLTQSKKTNAVAVANISGTNQELRTLAELAPERLPEVLGKMTIRVLIRRDKKFVSEQTWEVTNSEELASLIRSGRTFPFLLEEVGEGPFTYQVGVIPEKSKQFGAYSGERQTTISTSDTWWVASSRRANLSHDPALARLRDLLPRAANGTSFVPSVATTLPTGEPILVFSNTCQPPATAEVVGENISLPVEIHRERPDRDCGWAAATIPALTPGTWRFIPPQGKQSLEFQVVTQPAISVSQKVP